MLAAIDAELRKPRVRQGVAYRIIASWPFSSYLTTNFDDHLQIYLQAARVPVVTRRNKEADIAPLRADSRDLVVKIHGDCSVPEDMVLTTESYREFRDAASRKYWREKIRALLGLVDIVIIGYSASDADFQDQLERAKEIAAPDHPVFMFASDVSPSQMTQVDEYNIRVIAYDNPDGTHSELHRMLRRYDSFVAKRGSQAIGQAEVDSFSASTASAMYLFTRSRLTDTIQPCVQRAYAAVILTALSEMKETRELGLADLVNALAAKTFAASHVDPVAMKTALDYLHSQGLVDYRPDLRTVRLQPRGETAILSIKGERDLIRERFEQACRIYLKREHPALQNQSCMAVIEALELGIVRAYEKRGIEIARSVFSDVPVDISDSTDVLVSCL